MSYVKSLYHIVICTKNMEMVISDTHKKELYKYIWGTIKNKKCVLLQINGIPNHIHLLADISSDVSISEFVRDIKRTSSVWVKESRLFPMFKGWGHEYAAFSCSHKDSNNIIDYIKNQETHHISEIYDTEYQNMILKNGLIFYEFPNS